MDSISAFEAIEQRQAVRHFSSRKIPDQLMYQLLELSNRAPSGYNLQPWHFILVRDNDLKQLLYHVALEQEQILSAPEIVVFVADPNAWKNSYYKVIEASLEAETMTEEHAKADQINVNMLFSTDPFGLFGFVKKLSVPLRRLKKPMPQVITTKQEAVHYVRSHAMFAAATFMIAAKGAGLATCPIESFDEERLKKLLAVPKTMSIPLIIPTGYALEGGEAPRSIRLPLIEKLSVDLFPNILSKLKNREG